MPGGATRASHHGTRGSAALHAPTPDRGNSMRSEDKNLNLTRVWRCPMFFWIYDLPTWPMVGLFCAFFVGVTWLGILFVRPILRAILGRSAGLNDSVGYLLGAHGVYLGVL